MRVGWWFLALAGEPAAAFGADAGEVVRGEEAAEAVGEGEEERGAPTKTHASASASRSAGTPPAACARRTAPAT